MRSYTRYLVSLFLIGSAMAAIRRPLCAQSAELRTGQVARVSATQPRLAGFVGHVVAITSDTLWLETDEPQARIGIPRSALTAAEVRLPDASRAEHVVAGAVGGVLAGAALGAVTGYATTSCSNHRCSDGFRRGLAVYVGGIAGATLGLAAGTAIGLILPVDRWSPVQSFRSAHRWTLPGAELRVALRF
jgi:RNase P/RNase MRP subunit p29